MGPELGGCFRRGKGAGSHGPAIMSGKKHDINITQYVGIGLFVFALVDFMDDLVLFHYV